MSASKETRLVVDKKVQIETSNTAVRTVIVPSPALDILLTPFITAVYYNMPQ